MGERKFRGAHRCYNPYVPTEIWELFKKDLRKLFKHVFPEQKFAITEYYRRNFPVDWEYIKTKPADDHPVDWQQVCNVVDFAAHQFGMKILICPHEDPEFTLGNIRTWTIEQLDAFLANHSYEDFEKKYDNRPAEVIRTEEEKLLHQCCITGHKPELLHVSEEEVKHWLEEQIDQAIADGYDTFIIGCTKGVELWAGEMIVQKRLENSNLHMFAATPNDYSYAKDWDIDWRRKYSEVRRCADEGKGIGDFHEGDSVWARDVWMADNCSRLIAYYTGDDDEVKSLIDYAKEHNVPVITP